MHTLIVRLASFTVLTHFLGCVCACACFFSSISTDGNRRAGFLLLFFFAAQASPYRTREYKNGEPECEANVALGTFSNSQVYYNNGLDILQSPGTGRP